MNEAGLVVEIMWLAEAVYPTPDERPAISELQWIQYQLDNYATVAEVLASDADLRIQEGSRPLHFLICDASGDCAVIEFLEGELVTHNDDDLPYPTLTNSTYDDSMAYADKYFSNAVEMELPAGGGSLERFTRACDLSTRFDGAAPTTDYAFSILDNVASTDEGTPTVWSIVYDYGDSRIYFKTAAVLETRYIDTSAFDYYNATPVKILNMNADLSGDVTAEFVDYTYEANRALIGASFAGTEFLKDVPEESLDEIAKYPESCVGE
jgi:choloylglycine hydrolase